jgi:hypothetical protein
MEINEAKTIVRTLAQGIDPDTGEVFAPDSPYNHPKVIRALFTLHDLARPPARPRMTVEQRRQANLERGLPANSGLPWIDADRVLVGSEFKKGKSVEELASVVERTRGAIHAELIKQGLVTPDFR